GDVLRAVSLDGRSRVLLSIPTDGKLLDVAKDGRVLLESEAVVRHIEAWPGTEKRAHDLSLFDQSIATVVSPDGRSVLITDQGRFAGTSYATYLRRLDQPEAVRLGDGQAQDFSPDMRSVLSVVTGPPSR